MNADTFRQFLKAPDEVKHPKAAAWVLSISAAMLLVIAGIAISMSDVRAGPPILAGVAVIAVIATLRSAGITFARSLPSMRTSIAGTFAVVSLMALGAALVTPPILEAQESTDRVISTIFLSLPVRIAATGEPARATRMTADRIDNGVRDWLASERKAESNWTIAVYRALPWAKDWQEKKRNALVSSAESRLKHLSRGAPAWEVTAGLCVEFRRGMPDDRPLGLDFTNQYERVAKDYSALLGREVKAADLMPLVPGGKCE